MSAGSKRANRVKMRKQDERHTGVSRRAKRNAKNPKFDTQAESYEVAQELGNRKKFHERDLLDVKPLNQNQEDFLHLYYQGCPLIIADGPAGTAKTFLSMYCALSDVFRDDTPYQKVIVARSAVPSRDQGFLPGTEEEKNEPYEAPYKQVCKELLPKYKEGYQHLKSLGYLEFVSTSYLRGITCHDSIIIVDEFSSCTYHELATIVTRVGSNSRIIFAGDFKQSDLNKGREESGYKKFLTVVNGMPDEMFGHVTYGLDDIVRSGLVQHFLISDFKNG